MKEIAGPSFKISCVMWATDLTDADYVARNADLSLIAAAPELLAALQGLVATLNAAGYGTANADEAIAKATGEGA